MKLLLEHGEMTSNAEPPKNENPRSSKIHVWPAEGTSNDLATNIRRNAECCIYRDLNNKLSGQPVEIRKSPDPICI